MATALYQRYRPQQFADLVGQDHIQQTILSEIMHDDIAHAYLFSGPRGVGKTSVARLVARAVNCTQRTVEGEPCNACVACRSIIEQKTLDVVEIDAASHTGVDHVREHIIERVRTAPASLRYTVFIIDEVHMLSGSAFNALLKTLEEPPRHAVFVLATTELHKVPATIISRCEHFRFKRLDTQSIVERLRAMCAQENRVVADEVLHIIAQKADGGMRDAQSILGQVLSAVSSGEITLDAVAEILHVAEIRLSQDILHAVFSGDMKGALASVAQGVEQGAQAHEVVRKALELLRGVLLAAASQDVQYIGECVTDAGRVEEWLTFAMRSGPESLARMIDFWIHAAEQLKAVPLPQLALELAIVQSMQVIASSQAAARQGEGTRSHDAEARAAQEPVQSKNKTVTPAAPRTNSSTPTPRSKTTVTPVVEKKVQAEEVQKTVVTQSPVTAEDVQAKWTAVLDAMKKRNNGLHLTLQVGQFVEFKDNAIVLGFQYPFYRDRLHDARNQTAIDEALAEVFGPGLHLRAMVGEMYAIATQSSAEQNVSSVDASEVQNVWDLAVQAFQPNRVDEEAR